MKRLKYLRKESNLTQEELASKFNNKYGTKYTKSTISLMENGKRYPEMKNIEKFSVFFKVPLEYLMGWSNEVGDHEYNYFTIKYPSHIIYDDKEGTSCVFETTERDIYDIHSLLHIDLMEVYYKDKTLTSEEKQKILTMLATILE